ncbi:MAG: FtsX-like permease family protein, partial [Bacteroidota bacterium]
MKNLPVSTHLKIDYLASMVGSGVDTNNSRTWSAVSIYALLKSSNAANSLSKKMRDFQYRFKEGIYTPAEIDRGGDFYEIHPITDIHLHSHREKEMSANSDIRYIYLFSVLTILIILIASINFINLFTSQTLKRTKEIGVRRAIGAQKGQLALQFFGESFFMVTLAATVALLLAFLALPLYNQVAALNLSTQELFSLQNLVILFGLVLATSLISGAYPAWMVVKLKVISSLKNKVTSNRGASSIRQTLIGFQFLISVLILISTLAINRQMTFVHNKNLGFDKEQLVAIKLYGALWPQAVEHQETFLAELLRNPHVSHATVVSKLVGERFGYESI